MRWFGTCSIRYFLLGLPTLPLMLALAGCHIAPPVGSPAKADLADACTLVTPAEIEEQTGMHIQDNKRVPRDTEFTIDSKSGPSQKASPEMNCFYTVQSVSASGFSGSTLAVNIMTPAGFQQAKAQTRVDMQTKQEFAKQPVPGIGDDAVWDDHAQTIFVLKGSVAFSIDMPFSKKGTTPLEGAKALARKALARL